MSRSPYRPCLGLASVLIILLLPSVAAADNDKMINVSITPDGPGQYRLDFDDSECPTHWNEKRGCVYQKKGWNGKIRWRLDRADHREGWNLEQLYFGTKEKQSGVTGFPLMNCLVDDFGFDPNDAATGFVSAATQKAGGEILELRNETMCDEEYFIYYKLVARKGNLTAESDPIISNGGRPDRNQ
ncbi:MAG: hypothetical protein KJO70_08020 [Gammaproteobacteria bacterium]|nr:hypothetical protein [Gammaproteobacteria bacterium]